MLPIRVRDTFQMQFGGDSMWLWISSSWNLHEFTAVHTKNKCCGGYRIQPEEKGTWEVTGSSPKKINIFQHKKSQAAWLVRFQGGPSEMVRASSTETIRAQVAYPAGITWCGFWLQASLNEEKDTSRLHQQNEDHRSEHGTWMGHFKFTI